MSTKEENNFPEKIEVKSERQTNTLSRPNPFMYKWAETALTNKEATVVIPPDKDENINTANGRASIETGFPAITMKSVLQGGVPPWGSDHNGILYKITEGIQWTQAGGLPVFNQCLSNRIGGYAKGALLQSTNIDRAWVLWTSLTDNNTIPPAETDLSLLQSGSWRRFPAVSSDQKNIIRYASDGQLYVGRSDKANNIIRYDNNELYVGISQDPTNSIIYNKNMNPENYNGLYSKKTTVSIDSGNQLSLGKDGGLYVAKVKVSTDTGNQLSWDKKGALYAKAPVSGKIGNMVSYDENNQLFVPSASYITSVYVDSDSGDDIKGNGKPDNPFRSIYRAIISAPDFTTVSVHLNANAASPYYYVYNVGAGHGHIRMDNNDPVWDYPGQLGHDNSIWSQLQYAQSLSVGSRKVTIDTYGDTVYEEAVKAYKAIGSPIDPSAFVDIKRPNIVGFWKSYKDYERTFFLSFQGTDGDSQISFVRVQISIHDVESLTNAYPALVGLLWSGPSYSFTGVIFHTLPNGANHYFADGGGGGKSYYSIGYCRFESFDSKGKFTGKFLLGSGASQVTINEQPSPDSWPILLDHKTVKKADGGVYNYIDMNQWDFLTRIEAYEQVTPVKNPNDSYQGLITNYPIKGWKEWWKINNPEWLRQNGFADWL